MKKVYEVGLKQVDTAKELERYNLIADYYKENDSEELLRAEFNEDYLFMITDRLWDISKEEISKQSKNLTLKLFNFFAEKSNYI